MSSWDQGSFRTTMTPQEMQRKAEAYMRRKRDLVPPPIDFDQLQSDPEQVEMPEFTKNSRAHAPLIPEEKECPSPKK